MRSIRSITSAGLLFGALMTTLPARAEVIAWGLNNAGQCNIPSPPAGAEWVAIAAGDESTLLLASDGSVTGVGWCGAGQCFAPALPTGKRYVAIAAGNACGAALRNDGELFVFGSNEWGQHEVPALPPGIVYVEVAVGWDHVAARRSDGTVVVWGRCTYGECNVPGLPPGVTYAQISAGVYFSVALCSDGQVRVWGYIPGYAPPLPPGCTYVEVKAGYNFALARRSDGVVVGFGSNSHQQCEVPALPQGLEYVEIEAGRTSAIARRSDGSVVAWGDNAYGQSEVPAWPPATTCAEIALGWSHSAVRLTGGGPTISSCRTLQVYDPITGAFDPTLLNISVTVEGVVYVAPGTYSGGGGGFLQDETGGINFWREQMPTNIHVGDRIRVTGPIWPDLGMLYVGTYTYTKLDSNLVPLPTDCSVGQLLGDFSNTGSYVRVHGTVRDLTSDSFWLEDGTQRVEVLRSDYANISFGLLAEGCQCEIVSPCLMNLGTVQLMPVGSGIVPGAWFRPILSDVLGDQGGHLRVSWQKHAADGPSVPFPVTSYDVQRLGLGWQTIATLAAAAADSYAAVIDTPDILTIGQPAPYSLYRLVARTANPVVLFESVVDSAFSVDNLPPPRPVAGLADGLDYRLIYWQSPDIPDLESGCVYRGEEPDFVANEPIACPEQTGFLEAHLAWYFYRVQFSDIHGNLSEFSDELHGRWPTPVPDAVPHALKLYPCQPNPFNPRTTIKYDLPESGPVRLSVFDVAGRLVRTLVDVSVPQGSHEAVWDGRDASGREVGSGSYLARLEFGERMETVRMGLVR